MGMNQKPLQDQRFVPSPAAPPPKRSSTSVSKPIVVDNSVIDEIEDVTIIEDLLGINLP